MGSFKIRRDGQSTPALAPDISAGDMKKALSGLRGVGKVFVTRKVRGATADGKFVKYSWIVVFLEKLGNQPSLVSDDRLLTCSELGIQFGVVIEDEYRVGLRPLLDSGNKGEMILSGDDIAGDIISVEIPNLIRGEGYHVRVSAWNGVGYSYGLTQFSTPAVQYPAEAPDSPAYVLALPASSTELNVSFIPPLSDNGSPVTKYKVEWDGAAGISEVQAITTSASSSLDGTFRLSFRGHSTSALPYDASDERLQVALEGLRTVGKVRVERTGPISNGFMWEVTFLQNVGNVPLISLDPTGLVGNGIFTDVSELIKGTEPSFDQGTVGIHEMPLGSTELVVPEEVQEIALSAQAEDGRILLRQFHGRGNAKDIPQLYRSRNGGSATRSVHCDSHYSDKAIHLPIDCSAGLGLWMGLGRHFYSATWRSAVAFGIHGTKNDDCCGRRYAFGHRHEGYCFRGGEGSSANVLRDSSDADAWCDVFCTRQCIQ